MTPTTSNIFELLRNGLIVSCQASEGDAFRDSGAMARFAKAAVDGGARGIRANGPEDIRAIREAVSVPVIGLQKSVAVDGAILITPSFEAARELALAGAGMIAVDCTARGQRMGALDRVRAIRRELGVPVLADIATAEEAVTAVSAGAAAVASTMRGYTAETRHLSEFQPQFIAELVRAVAVPVLAEGHILLPSQARAALRSGALAVIVGTAITRPHEITAAYVRAMAPPAEYVAAVDMGGTNTKSGVVSRTGELRFAGSAPTPFSSGRQGMLDHLNRVVERVLATARAHSIAPSRVGVATAGWVDPRDGHVIYATENLPGWTGADIAGTVQRASGLPVAVENDANALAAGERVFGAARDVRNFVCITLGTGVGGGCYIDGALNHGSHYLANALGHVPCIPGGLACTCGLSGCLEVYTNAAALLGYANGRFDSAQTLIEAAHAGDATAKNAIRQLAGYLAVGIGSMVQLLDPELIVLAGGLAQSNPLLLEFVKEALETTTTVHKLRQLRVCASEFGSHGGVMGAAAIAMERGTEFASIQIRPEA
jgi:predicted NBD/HSP70 family sugar kinase/putative N-acetylmannosamine-6-phosphate epimerase